MYKVVFTGEAQNTLLCFETERETLTKATAVSDASSEDQPKPVCMKPRWEKLPSRGVYTVLFNTYRSTEPILSVLRRRLK